jgi:hypothetical protein
MGTRGNKLPVGQKKKAKPHKPLKERICPLCFHIQPASNTICTKCKLDLEEARKIGEQNSRRGNAIRWALQKRLKRENGRKRDPAFGTVDFAFAILPGGREEGMMYAALAAKRSREVSLILARYDSLDIKEKKHCLIHKLCEDCGVDQGEFLGEIVKVAHKFNTEKAYLTIAASLGEIVDASIKRAKGKDASAIQDARMLGETVKFFPPVKSGMNVAFNNLVDAGGRETREETEFALPDFASRTVESCEILRDAEIKQLPGGEAEAGQ